MATASPAPKIARLLYSPAETGSILGLSRASVYDLIRDGKLDARKVGSATRITAASIERLPAELPKSSAAPQPEPAD
jgi:excisionase family DNA binding protein